MQAIYPAAALIVTAWNDNKDELFESSPVRQSWNNTDEQNLDITKRDLIECINIYRKPQTKKHEDHFLKRSI